jgi:hypothetical protein
VIDSFIPQDEKNIQYFVGLNFKILDGTEYESRKAKVVAVLRNEKLENPQNINFGKYDKEYASCSNP